MKRILIVDDDMSSLIAAKQALQNDYMLTLVKSGQQALAYLSQHTCDLILLDYEMPLMNGVKVLEKLRSDFRTASIPVVFLTGNSRTDEIHAALALRPDGYILKPFHADDLKQRVKNIIGN